MSDVEITRICGLLEFLEEGDVAVADNNLSTQKEFEVHKASLNIPPFRKQNTQFRRSEVAETQEIAILRLNVIHLGMVGSVCQLLTIAVLTNFRGPFIIEKM